MPSDAWIEDWLRLSLVPGLGSVTLRRLLTQFGTPGDVLRASPARVSSLLPGPAREGWQRGADPASVSRALEWGTKPGHAILTLDHPDYPRALLQIADPPCVLYALGDPGWLGRPALAVVGSRNSTPQGKSTAEAFAEDASHAGLTIASGLAVGIDAAAHRGGLKGPGSTVAVVGTGADIVYPARHRELAREIAERGVVVSEFPLGTPPHPSNFPRRNRTLSGLSLGVLVVEAAIRSGSLITARFAAEQGREVLAIPGSIHSPLSRGCHSLIKQGAKLVESAADLLEELRWTSRLQTGDAVAPAPDAGGGILDAMGFDPCDLETIAERAGLTAEEAVVELLRLELDGKVAPLPGGRYQRVA